MSGAAARARARGDKASHFIAIAVASKDEDAGNRRPLAHSTQRATHVASDTAAANVNRRGFMPPRSPCCPPRVALRAAVRRGAEVVAAGGAEARATPAQPAQLRNERERWQRRR
jgi:hypothetical protein